MSWNSIVSGTTSLEPTTRATWARRSSGTVDHRDVRVDGRERVVADLGAAAREGIEQRRLAGVRQADDADLHGPADPDRSRRRLRPVTVGTGTCGPAVSWAASTTRSISRSSASGPRGRARRADAKPSAAPPSTSEGSACPGKGASGRRAGERVEGDARARTRPCPWRSPPRATRWRGRTETRAGWERSPAAGGGGAGGGRRRTASFTRKLSPTAAGATRRRAKPAARRSPSTSAAASASAIQTAPHSPAVPRPFSAASAGPWVASRAHGAQDAAVESLKALPHRREDRGGRIPDPRESHRWAVAAARMVPGYRHRPGNHCGSTALRNLLAYHGRRDLRGDGARARRRGELLLRAPRGRSRPRGSPTGAPGGSRSSSSSSPGRRSGSRPSRTPTRSWEAARGGRRRRPPGDPASPTSTTSTTTASSAHFPGHAVVLAGYDSEVAYLSDTGFEELQTTRLENLARARHGEHPVFPLDGHMFTVPDPGATLKDADATPRPARSPATRAR